MVLHHCSLQESIPGEEDVFFTELRSKGEYGSIETLETSILERSEVIVGQGATCWMSRMEGSLSSDETDKDKLTPSPARADR